MVNYKYSIRTTPVKGVRRKALFGSEEAAILGAAAINAVAQASAAAVNSRAQANAAKQQSAAIDASAKANAQALKEQNENSNNLQKENQEFIREQNERNRDLQKDIQMQLQMLTGQQNQNAREEASKIQVKNGGAMSNKSKRRINPTFPLRGGYIPTNSYVQPAHNSNLPFRVTDGGGVIPLGKTPEGFDMYELYGHDHDHYHKAQGGKYKSGVGIKFANGQTIEGEGNQGGNRGEKFVVTPNDAFFISKHNIGGFNPANAVDRGLNPVLAFNIQESIKQANGIPDNGKYKDIKMKPFGGLGIMPWMNDILSGSSNTVGDTSVGVAAATRPQAFYGINLDSIKQAIGNWVASNLQEEAKNAQANFDTRYSPSVINANGRKTGYNLVYDSAGNLGNMGAGERFLKGLGAMLIGNFTPDAVSPNDEAYYAYNPDTKDYQLLSTTPLGQQESGFNIGRPIVRGMQRLARTALYGNKSNMLKLLEEKTAANLSKNLEQAAITNSERGFANYAAASAKHQPIIDVLNKSVANRRGSKLNFNQALRLFSGNPNGQSLISMPLTLAETNAQLAAQQVAAGNKLAAKQLWGSMSPGGMIGVNDATIDAANKFATQQGYRDLGNASKSAKKAIANGLKNTGKYIIKHPIKSAFAAPVIGGVGYGAYQFFKPTENDPNALIKHMDEYNKANPQSANPVKPTTKAQPNTTKSTAPVDTVNTKTSNPPVEGSKAGQSSNTTQSKTTQAKTQTNTQQKTASVAGHDNTAKSYDNMSFSSAFESARKNGDKTFNWKGKSYATIKAINSKNLDKAKDDDDFSSYNNFNNAFDAARKSGVKTFTWGGKRYTTDLEKDKDKEARNRRYGSNRWINPPKKNNTKRSVIKKNKSDNKTISINNSNRGKVNIYNHMTDSITTLNPGERSDVDREQFRCGGLVSGIRRKGANGIVTGNRNWNLNNTGYNTAQWLGAGLNSFGNVLGGWLSARGNTKAARTMADAYAKAGNTMADAYRNLQTINVNDLINRSDYKSAHAMAAIQSPLVNVNPQLTKIDRDAERIRTQVLQNTGSGAAANKMINNINTNVQDRRNEVFDKAEQQKQAIIQENMKRITDVANENANRDIQTNKDYTAARLQAAMYNNDIVNQRIIGASSAIADAGTQGANTLGQAQINNANILGQSIATVGSNFGNALSAVGKHNADVEATFSHMDKADQFQYGQSTEGTSRQRQYLAGSMKNVFDNNTINDEDLGYLKQLATNYPNDVRKAGLDPDKILSYTRSRSTNNSLSTVTPLIGGVVPYANAGVMPNNSLYGDVPTTGNGSVDWAKLYEQTYNPYNRPMIWQ